MLVEDYMRCSLITSNIYYPGRCYPSVYRLSSVDLTTHGPRTSVHTYGRSIQTNKIKVLEIRTSKFKGLLVKSKEFPNC